MCKNANELGHCILRGVMLAAAVAVVEPSPGGGGQFLLDDVHCNGSESSLLDCQHSPLFEHNCISSEVAGVSCYNGIYI